MFLLLGHLTGQAQAVNNQIKDVVMPSPNAASLGKYGDIPVSYYTGVPNVGIPIHTLSEGSISLPISLSYHAGGIKVGEPSSWVGQNWSLQAGGMISRTVQGKADESCGGFFTTGNEISTFEQNSYGITPARTETCITTTANVSNNGLANGTQDSEPDIFSFSVGGYNGKFYIEAPTIVNGTKIKGKVILIPKQDVSIDYTIIDPNGGDCSDVFRIKRFTLITPEGVKYEFGSCDNSTDAIEIMNNNESNFWRANGWYLKKITSADGVNSIVLNYTGEAYRYNYRVTTGAPTTSNPWPRYAGGFMQNTVDIKGFRLKDIQTSTGKVTFVEGAERTVSGGDFTVSPYASTAPSMGNAKRLDRIKVENGSECKDFILSQSYFQDNDVDNKTGQSEDYRLRLDAVQEKSCDATISVPPHVFTYYGKTGNLNYLPSRLSSAIDHWGYYNNATTNSHGFNIPYTRLSYLDKNSPNDAGTPRLERQGSSNRESDEESMKWGTIKQIQYPTGGSTIFEYEANAYWNTDGIKTLQVQNSDVNNYPNIFCQNTSNKTSGITRTFTADDLNNMFFKVEYISGLPAGATGTPCQNISPSITITAVEVNNPAAWCSYNIGANTASVLKETPLKFLKDEFSCLSVGVNYKFEITVWAAGARLVLYKEITTLTNATRKVGGLRIKKITNNDGISTGNDVVKTYEYGTTLSSGVLFQKPIYGTVYEGYLGECSGNISPQYRTINFFMDNAIVPLGSFEGGHINYNAVQENYMVNGVRQYYTVYEYNNEPLLSQTINNQGFVLLPLKPIQPRIGSGELLRKGHWNGNSNTETASEEYTNYSNDNYVDGVGNYIKFNTYMTYGSSGIPISFWIKYKIRNKPYRLSSVTTIQDGITTTTNYSYLSGILPKKTESVLNSNGQTTTTTYFYASELGLTDLINRNMIGFPAKVKQQTGNAVKWSKVEYALFNGSTQLEPQYLKECFDANETNWITRLYISAYTANGMPSSVFKNNFAVPENYSWNNKLLTQKQFGTGTNLLTWLIAYKTGTSLVEKVTDENGLIKKFTYDKLSRLSILQDRMKPDGTDVQATTTYDYHYKGQSTTNSIDINSNFVGTSTTFVNATTATPLSTKQYLDGLGRGLSTVRETYTPGLLHQKNNVTYDVLGRSDRSYLPFESGSLGYEPTGGSIYAFTTYEASPLSRPLKQTNVDGTGITISYGANVAADNVRKFTFTPVQGAPGSVVNNNVYYTNNDLYKTCTWNENGTFILPTITTIGKTEIYKDKLGRVILTRKFLSGQNVDTYNVYDDYSNLVMVIPPGAADGYGNPIGTLVFTYTYDYRNRMIEKKVPNAAPQKFFYDNRDLLTLTQDGNLALQAKYVATQYDEIGRVVKTGFVTPSDPITFANSNFTIANDANKLTETKYYNNKTWVNHQGAKVIYPNNPTSTDFVWSYIERRLTTTAYKGNPAWMGKQHLMNGALPNRPILDSDGYGVDWAVSDYNGLQQPDYTIRYLYGKASTGNQVRTRTEYTYDNGRRMTNAKYIYAFDGAGVGTPTFTLSNMVYNYKDQVTEKNTAFVAGKYLQSTDFAYNLRGWLTSINSGFQQTANDYPLFSCNGWEDYYAYGSGTYPSNMPFTPAAQNGEHNPDLFKEIISYEGPNYLFPNASQGQYNGNISQIEWQVAGKEAQGYSFKYDNLDRLTEANYADIHSSNYSSHGWTQQYKTDNKYQEKVSYDLRGNITALERNGLTSNCMTYNGFVGGLWGKIDNLTYNYDPADLNKLIKVTDAADLTRGFKSVNNNSTYTYDANGNLTSDLNKNITGITYNYLNLPLVISFTGNNRIEFIYDATGAKLRKSIYVNNVLQPQETRDYVNGVEYKGGVVDRFAHTEGAVVRQADGTTFSHEYTIKDHLGNARVTYNDANNDGIVTVADIKQINNFYPFGLNMEGNWNGAAGSNKYQYNGKEWNDDFGLGLNDYGARFYDPAIARWTAVDPLGEMRANVTPYQYVQNNPMNRIDPTGMLDESRGADGMTNSQWMNASNPNNYGSGLESNYRNQNRNEDIDKERKRDKMKKSISDGLKRNAEDGDGEDDAPDWVKELMDPEYDSNEGSKAAYVIPRAIPLAAVDGPVPIADAIVAVGVAAALAYDAALRTYITYEIYNPALNQYYVGRASGFGTSTQIFKRRFGSHKFKDFISKNGGIYSIDATIQSYPAGYWAIRGREQQLYDYHKNLGHILANSSRPVFYYHPLAYFYHQMSNVAFGEIAPYTGFQIKTP